MDKKFQIEVAYRQMKKDGKVYNILETCDLGFKISIMSDIPPVKANDGKMYITYEAKKAYIFQNKSGYMTLKIDK